MRHKNSEICIFKCFVFFLLSLLSQVKEFRKTCFIFWYQSPVSTPVVASSNTIYHNVMIHQQQKLYDNSTFSGNLLAMIRILSYHYVRSIIFSEDGIGRMLKLLLQLEQSLHFTPTDVMWRAWYIQYDDTKVRTSIQMFCDVIYDDTKVRTRILLKRRMATLQVEIALCTFKLVEVVPLTSMM